MIIIKRRDFGTSFLSEFSVILKTDYVKVMFIYFFFFNRPPPCLGTQDFTNPLAGPDEEHILPYCKYKKLEKPCKYPEPRDYVEEICKKYPAAKRVLADPPYGPLNYDVIDKIYDDENRTTYMHAYCKIGE